MRPSRLWAAAEVGIIFVLVMLDIWVFRPYPALFYGAQVVLLAFVAVGFTIRIRSIKKGIPENIDPALKNALIAEKISDCTEELGIGQWRKSARGGWFVSYLDFRWAGKLACGVALGLALVLIAGCFFKPAFWETKDFWAKKIYLGTLKYILWGTVQQFFLQGYVATRIYSIFAKSPDPGVCEHRAAVLTAICAGILFFFIHMPNPTLMIITPIAGAAAVYIFLNCRNIFMLGIAHGILGNTIGVCLANSLRVGPHYWQ